MKMISWEFLENNTITKKIIGCLKSYGGITVFSLLLSIVLLSVSQLAIGSKATMYTDSSVFITVAKVIQQGGVAYKDIFDHKGPLIYFIDYIGICINEQYGIWLLEILALTFSIILSYCIVKKVFTQKIMCLVIVAATWFIIVPWYEGGNLVEEWALPFIMVGIWSFVKYLEKKCNWIIGSLNGVACGCVLLLRPNMIGTWFSICFIMIVLSIQRKKSCKLLCRDFGFFILGIVCSVGSCVLYYIQKDAFRELIDCYIEFNMDYVGNKTIDVLITAIQRIYCQNYVGVIVVVSMILFCYSIKKQVFTEKFWGLTAGFVSLIVNIVCSVISGRGYGHYGMIIIPSILLCMTYGSALIIEILPKSEKNFGEISILVIIFILYLSKVPDTICNNITVYFNNAIQAPKSHSEQLINYIKEHTATDECVVIFDTGGCTLYREVERMPALRYAYVDSLIEINNEIVLEIHKQLIENTPNMVIINKNTRGKYEYCATALYDYIQNNYIMAEEMDGYQIFIKNTYE